mgnify:CR=1 FL=1
MKKTLISFSIAALTGLTGAAQAQTVLTASTWLPPSHPATLAQKEWCEMLTTNTQGRVKCNLLPRAVSAPPGTFDAVMDLLEADVLMHTEHHDLSDRIKHLGSMIEEKANDA